MIEIQENTNNKSQQNSISINPATQLSQQSNPTNAKYIYVIYEDGAWGMHKHLKPLGAVRDELGWWINNSIENRNIVMQLCKQAGLTYLLRDDLPANDLETYGRLNRLEYHQEQAAKNKQEFDHLKFINKLEDIDINISLDDLKEKTKNEAIITQHKEYHERQKSIIRLQKEAMIVNIHLDTQTYDQKPKVNIQFLSEEPINFLTEEAPPIPALLSIPNGTSEATTILPKGVVGMLVGAGGVGKTHWLTQLALAKTNGDLFLGKYLVNGKGNVFLALGENTKEDIHRLLRKTYIKMFPRIEDQSYKSDSCQRLAIMSVMGMKASLIDKDNNPTAFYNELLSGLKEKEPESGWDLIILDPISRFLGTKAETDNDAATQFIALLERICLELKGKPTVLFGHHMNKSGISGTGTDQTAARGSSGITDGTRWQANLELISTEADPKVYEPYTIMFRHVKSNHTAIAPAERLTRDGFGSLIAESAITPKTLRAKDLGK